MISYTISYDDDIYHVEIQDDVKHDPIRIMDTPVKNIYLYNNDKSEHGLISYSVHNTRARANVPVEEYIWIENVLCNILTLKGVCAKILFTIFYSFLKKNNVPDTTSLELIVQPVIDIKFHENTIRSQIANGTIENKQNTPIMELVRSLVVQPAERKVTELYQSFGFTDNGYKMTTTLGKLGEKLDELNMLPHEEAQGEMNMLPHEENRNYHTKPSAGHITFRRNKNVKKTTKETLSKISAKLSPPKYGGKSSRKKRASRKKRTLKRTKVRV